MNTYTSYYGEPEEVEFDAFDLDYALGIARVENNGATVGMDDIAEKVRYKAVSPEGYGSIELAGVFRLRDGRYLGIEAWADTTGWGCRDGADAYVGPSEDDVVLNGLTQEGRNFLGYEFDIVPGEVVSGE